MAVRLTGTFFTIHGAEYAVDIHDTDFSGSATSFEVKYCQISHDSEKPDDISSAIIGSRAEIGMVVNSTDTVLPAFIEDFAGGAEDRFFVQVRKVVGGLIVWNGILAPDFSGEEDTAPKYVFKVSALCGLALLKKKPYHDGTAIYTGIERLTKHLVTALTKLPHTATLWGASDDFLQTAVDWWAASMSSGSTDDALYQGGVDHSVFYDYKTQGSVDKDVLSCYDVIWHICKTFNCRIYQMEGTWFVEQIPYRTALPYYSRFYDKSGGYLSVETNVGTNDIDNTENGAKIATGNYDFIPALRRSEVNYDVKIRRNFLNGANLFSTAPTINFDQNISSNGGDGIVRLRGTISFGVKNLSYSGAATDVIFLTPKFTLMIGANYLKRAYTISNFTATVDPPQWTTNSADRIAIPHNLGPVGTVGSQINGTISFEILSPVLPSDGDNNQLTLEVQSLQKWDGTGISDSQFQIFWSASNMFLEVYDDGTPVINEDQILYSADNPNTYSEVYETTIRLGTASLSNSAGRLMRWTGAAWVIGGNWGQGVEARDKAIGDLLALNLLNNRLSIRRRINGTLYGNFRMQRLVTTTDGRSWMMSSANWDIGKNTMQGTWFELDYGVDGVSATPIKKKVIFGGGVPPHVPDPVTPSGLTNTSPGFSINQGPTVLAPVAYNQISAAIENGDTVTSIPLKTASLGNEFLVGDGVTIVNPYSGNYQTFAIATAPAFGDTSLSVTSEVSNYDFPEDSYLVVKQNAYAYSLPNANQGEILRFNSVSGEWEAYAGVTDGHVLTWDTTNGWQAEAAAGGGLSDGDKGDITVSGGGTVWNIDAGVVGTTELADAGVTSAKLRDSAALSVIGRSASTTGVPGDIASTTDGHVLRQSGTAIGFGTVATAGIADDAVTYAKIQNVTNNRVLGRVTAGSGDVQELGPGTSMAFLNTGFVVRAALTGDVTAAQDSNATTIANDVVTNAKLANMAATTLKGNNLGVAADPVDLTKAQIQTAFQFLDGTLTATRVPYANGANLLTDSANHVWLNGTQEILIGGGTSRDARFAHNQTANITGNSTLIHGENNVSGDYFGIIKNTRNVSNTGRSIFILEVGGTSAGDAFFVVRTTGGDQWSKGLDKSDGNKYKITPKSTAPGSVANSGLIITNEAVAKVGVNLDAPAHPLDVSGRARSTQFINYSVAGQKPTVGTLGAGLGTGPVINDVSGSNNGFSITFTTGTTPTAGGNLFVVTFATAFPAMSFPVFCQGDDNSAAEFSKFSWAARLGGSFTLKARAGQALTASTQYVLLFNCFGI